MPPGHSKSFDEITARKVTTSSAATRRRAFGSRLLEVTVYTNRADRQSHRKSGMARWKSSINLKKKKEKEKERKGDDQVVFNRDDIVVKTRFSSRYAHKFQIENVDEIGTP